MCLDCVDEIFEPNDRMVVGYKVFKELGGGVLAPEIQDGKCYRVGHAYKAAGKMVTSPGMRYPTGFHTFTDFDGVKAWGRDGWSGYYEVHVWDIRAEGLQKGHKCCVAKNMRIIGPAE